MSSAHIPMIQWYPGHIAKAQPRLKAMVKLVDIVVEVLDARLPISSHFALAEQLSTNKGRILVLNKTDLVDRAQLTAWNRYWQAKGMSIVTMTKETDKGLAKLKAVLADEAKVLHARLGKRGILPRSLRTMVVGLPNVGKSSLINRLAKRRKAQVGDKPGVTRGTQWVRIAEGLELLDTPGLIPPRLDEPELSLKLAMIGAVSTESYDTADVGRVTMQYLNEVRPGYLDQIGSPPTIEAYAAKRGFIGPGGEPDINRTAKAFLMDLRDGRFGPIILDNLPEVSQTEVAEADETETTDDVDTQTDDAADPAEQLAD
ncbi:MAG: ribosome biogenesis GTPase YlqF [Candidatus Sericytochromatia bacterium]|nr:ribosome biogenesis GTPase YlqF [Candidatus Sericytochromatia bacterium]